jgi:Crp-like helix-turn-helix protein
MDDFSLSVAPLELLGRSKGEWIECGVATGFFYKAGEALHLVTNWHVMADLLNRNSRIEEDLIDQLFNSSEKRLARVLLLLANFGKEATTEPIIGNFSQETLAKMIGTTRSRVSFFMNKFRKLGYIEYNGKLEIRNSLLNVVLYDKPEIRKNDASEGPK